MDGLRRALTAGAARADCAVAGVAGVTSNVADLGVIQPLAIKVLAVDVLDAPEAAGGDGGLLRAGGDGFCCGGGAASDLGDPKLGRPGEWPG